MRTMARLAGALLLTLSAVFPAASSGAALPDARSGPLADDAPQGESGFLSVISDPAARISVDGKERGQTPVVKLELPVGPHQITLVSLDGKLKRTLGVKIVKGENTRLKVNLE